MKYIIGAEAVLTPEQERVLADFEIVQSLDLFPQELWSRIDDIEICYFGTWCHQVLTVDYFKFFHVNVNDDNTICEAASLKFCFCHLFQYVSV